MVVDQRTVGATSMDGPPVAPDGSGARPRYAHSPSRRSGKDRSRTLLLGVVGLVGVVGITMGAFVNFKMMVFNADTAHSAMLWYGVQHDGLSFLSTWYYSPDNWILSVLPLHFLAYGLFGVHPWVPMVIGWLTLPGSILLTGLIALQLGAGRRALWLVAVLAFVGVSGLGLGLLAYPDSHDVTNLYGLGCVVLSLDFWNYRSDGVRRPALDLVGLVALLVLGGASDPWMVSAYLVPLLVGGIFAGALAAGRERKLVHLAHPAAVLAAGVVIATKVFGLLSFVPSFPLHVGLYPTLWSNVRAYSGAIGSAFNLTKPLGLVAGSPGTQELLNAVVVVLILGLFLIAAVRLMSRRTPEDLRIRSFACVAVLSVLSVSASTVLTSTPLDPLGQRFYGNVFYLVPCLLVVAIGRMGWSFRRAEVWICTAAALLFVLGGFWSNTSYLAAHADGASQIQVIQQFLESHGLTYGYGAYWGSEANAVTALSQQRVIVRPVVFAPGTGSVIFSGRWEESKSWYLPSDVPPGQKQFFLAVIPDPGDCPQVSVCVDGATRQFGTPVEKIPFQDGEVLIWNHPLIGWSPRTAAH